MRQAPSAQVEAGRQGSANWDGLEKADVRDVGVILGVSSFTITRNDIAEWNWWARLCSLSRLRQAERLGSTDQVLGFPDRA